MSKGNSTDGVVERIARNLKKTSNTSKLQKLVNQEEARSVSHVERFALEVSFAAAIRQSQSEGQYRVLHLTMI